MIAILLAVLGAICGSFVGAQVWRLRARQLLEDKAEGETIDHAELVRLKGLVRAIPDDRSECLHCHHQLVWYDLIPVISWASLGGKCRYCRKPIGATEIALEIGLGAVFVISYFCWPVPLTSFVEWSALVLWLVACVILAIQFVYDARWSLLWTNLSIGLATVALGYALIQLERGGWQVSDIVSLFGGVGIIAGLYYLFSLNNWAGRGDAIIGVGLALLAGSWQQSVLVVFLANLLGCLLLIPLALQGKLHHKLHIPFGPFLILATGMTVLWGQQMIHYIFSTLLIASL